MSVNAILGNLREDIQKLADPKRAKILQRFFKTGKGEYGYGDKFLGITVPQSRKIAQKYKNLAFVDVKRLLVSKIHEERLIAILILVHNFSTLRKDASENKRKELFDFYLKHTKYVNNWDLVDLSADKIVGEYLLNKSRAVLFRLVHSKNIWERRISIIATFAFIKKGEFDVTLKITEALLGDKHDLIQKAVGWMLREIGKREEGTLVDFLKKNYAKIPRTTLRYAIERFPDNVRRTYLIGDFN